MNFLDRVEARISPNAALKRAKIRNEITKLNAESDVWEAGGMILDKALGTDVTNSGYSHGGASRRKSWAKKYYSHSLSPKSDIEKNRKLLRERSRDLAMNAPLATAAVNSTRTNCVGSGLVPKPKIDYEFLGISQESARELERLIKKEFALWAESSLCDNNDQNNFYELQQIAFTDWLRNGEEFVLIKYGKEQSYMPYRLRLKLVEADRICTEGSLEGEYDGYDKKEKNGNYIMNGVEIDKEGRVIAYHICSEFPGEKGIATKKWTRVLKRGNRTGNPNILHIFNGERADQYRGVPFLAPVIESLKQLTRYTEAEIMAAVINSMFSIFVKTEDAEGVSDFSGADDDLEEEANGEEDDEIEIGYGTVNFLKVGESIEAVESKHPSANFDGFVSAVSNQIGAALEISPEVLLKKFSNNFSASKGALNETWKAFKMRRKWFVNDFCQAVYELWFSEAVSTGRITAPGYFNNPLIKKAYTNATWNGPAQGQLDPLKEVNATVKRLELGLSTREDECAMMNGSDYEDNVRTLRNENEMLKKANEPLEEDGGKSDGSKN